MAETRLTLKGKTAEALQHIALQENRSVEDLLENLLALYQPQPGTLAELAQSARTADIHTGKTDTSERSREILRTEYADYLKRRQQAHNAD